MYYSFLIYHSVSMIKFCALLKIYC